MSRAWSCRVSSASTPPKILGCRVLTRPPRISGKPVSSSTSVTATPDSFRCPAVPPVETTRTPDSVSERQKSAIPVLSWTETRARRTGVTDLGKGIGSGIVRQYSKHVRHGRGGRRARTPVPAADPPARPGVSANARGFRRPASRDGSGRRPRRGSLLPREGTPSPCRGSRRRSAAVPGPESLEELQEDHVRDEALHPMADDRNSKVEAQERVVPGTVQ